MAIGGRRIFFCHHLGGKSRASVEGSLMLLETLWFFVLFLFLFPPWLYRIEVFCGITDIYSVDGKVKFCWENLFLFQSWKCILKYTKYALCVFYDWFDMSNIDFYYILDNFNFAFYFFSFNQKWAPSLVYSLLLQVYF